MKRTARDPRSSIFLRPSYLIDEMREYILTTGMLISNIEDELDEQYELGSLPELEPEREEVF